MAEEATAMESGTFLTESLPIDGYVSIDGYGVGESEMDVMSTSGRPTPRGTVSSPLDVLEGVLGGVSDRFGGGGGGLTVTPRVLDDDAFFDAPQTAYAAEPPAAAFARASPDISHAAPAALMSATSWSVPYPTLQPEESAQPARLRPPLTSPLSRRPNSSGGGAHYEESDLIEALRRVTWFAKLPYEQLRTLSKRGRLESIGRYRTIIREGNRGQYFYILLSGQVHCTSNVKKGLSVRLGAGSSFGEGALVTTVQREATVTAIEPCMLLLLTSEDIVGLDVELSTVRGHVISLLLESIYFFKDLTKIQQDELARCMSMIYHPPGSVVFEEDVAGDCMYVLLEGVVEMRKRTANSDDPEGLLLATFTPNIERPWFGELALLGGGKKRTCAAVCAESCKMLILKSADFAHFLEIVPSFQAMFMQQSVAYAALDAMRRQRDADDDILNVGNIFKRLPDFLRPRSAASSVDSSAAPVLARWREMVSAVLAKARLNAATADEDQEEMAARGAGVRRVSYVASNPRSSSPHDRRLSIVQAAPLPEAEELP